MRLFVLNCLLILTCFDTAAQGSAKLPSNMPNIEFDLKPGKLVNGVPETFTFVFANIIDRDVWLPPTSSCKTVGIGTGQVILGLNFKPRKPRNKGTGGNCAVGYGDMPSVIDQAKSWRILRPGDSYAIIFLRKNLFAAEQAAGMYDFYAEYRPPEIQPEDQRELTKAGIEIPNQRLESKHLIFRRQR